MFPKKRHVAISSEGWADNEEDGQTSVVVTFPDRTSWLSHFYTFKCVESIRHNALSLGTGPYIWASKPLILVDNICRGRIEAVIDEIIANDTFEYMFEFFGPVLERELDRYPEGFFDDQSVMDQDFVIKYASMLKQMLDQSSNKMKDDVKRLLFSDRDETAYNLSLLAVLQDRNITVSQLNNKGPELRNKWASHFAKDLSYEEQQSIYFDQFLWHLFSYKKRPFLNNELAIEAFNHVKKQQCYIFYQNVDHALFVINGADLDLAYFELDSDIYIVDKDFKWTYVKTHESECGPYFCYL